MLSTTSVVLAIALVSPPMESNVSSAPPWNTLPADNFFSAMAVEGYVDHDAARTWYGTAGRGVLLHGGMESRPNRQLENQAPVEFIEKGDLKPLESLVEAMSARQPV
jgi:hypothetical protein